MEATQHTAAHTCNKKVQLLKRFRKYNNRHILIYLTDIYRKVLQIYSQDDQFQYAQIKLDYDNKKLIRRIIFKVEIKVLLPMCMMRV